MLLHASRPARAAGPLPAAAASLAARVAAALLAFAAAAPSPARAQAPLIDGLGGAAGYGDDGQCLSPNDDGSSRVLNIAPVFPAGLRFFDQVHTQVFVNTNGNITFSGPVATYTPQAFPAAGRPMIAPYWGDVDIRFTGGFCQGGAGAGCSPCEPCHNPTENGVWWDFSPGRLIFTWDRVGYYSCHNNLRMSFQLVLTAAEGCAEPGDFDVEFRFNRCEWESGDASSGSGGFGGTEAQSGFDAGNGADFVEIEGSRDAGIANRLCTQSNVGEQGIWRFAIRGGVVLCPGAGEPCDTGQAGVCAAGRTQCVGDGRECRAEVAPSDERCDALDNDCDGETDEGEGLCPEGQLCDRGLCVTPCFEFGCPEGQVCDEGGLCVDPACRDVKCPAGQVCLDGACAGPCDGVRCPDGQACRAGRCQDPCAKVECDECTACDDGTCVLRCEYVDCPGGEACADDGRCLPAACAAVDCAPGESCRDGACVDACRDVVCPRDQACEAGECVAARPGSRSGPGPGPGSDGGAGPGPGLRAGGADGGPGEAGVLPETAFQVGGCLCVTAGRAAGRPASGAPAAVLVCAALALARRRRGAGAPRARCPGRRSWRLPG